MSCPRENINGEIAMGWNLIYKESGSNSRGGRSLNSTHLLVAPEWTPTMPLGVHIPALKEASCSEWTLSWSIRRHWSRQFDVVCGGQVAAGDALRLLYCTWSDKPRRVTMEISAVRKGERCSLLLTRRCTTALLLISLQFKGTRYI